MKKQIILGQVRELLMIIGSLCFAHFEGVPSVVGALVAALAVVFAVRNHEGKEIIFSAVRKGLTFIPACLVAFEVIPTDKAVVVGSALMSSLALVWSFVSNSDKPLPKSSVLVLPIVAFMSLGFFPSCTLAMKPEESLRLPHGVLLSQDGTGKAKAEIDSQTITTWVGSLTRILRGEDPKEVILAPLSNPYGSK